MLLDCNLFEMSVTVLEILNLTNSLRQQPPAQLIVSLNCIRRCGGVIFYDLMRLVLKPMFLGYVAHIIDLCVCVGGGGVGRVSQGSQGLI